MYTVNIHKVLLDDPWHFNNPIALQFAFEVVATKENKYVEITSTDGKSSTLDSMKKTLYSVKDLISNLIKGKKLPYFFT